VQVKKLEEALKREQEKSSEYLNRLKYLPSLVVVGKGRAVGIVTKRDF